MTNRRALAREPFSSAANKWFEGHQPYIRPTTQRVYKQYVEKLIEFFKETRLCDIDADKLRSYQLWRKEAACGLRIRCECVVFKMIMREAGQWERLKDTYRLIPIEKKQVRKNMRAEEEKRFLDACLAKPSRLLAGHCMRVMMMTSMGFGELRHVKREEVVLDEEPPYVIVNGGSKNDYRERSITLNRIALESLRWIVRRWEQLGGTEAQQYILPHRSRKGSGPLFDVPMGHIDNAARGILNDAGLSKFVLYDMRSHAITKILSDPECSDQVYTELAGHSPKSKQIRMRYSKQRLETKARITDKLCEPTEPEQTAEPEKPPATPVANPSSDVNSEILSQLGIALQQIGTVLERMAK